MVIGPAKASPSKIRYTADWFRPYSANSIHLKDCDRSLSGNCGETSKHRGAKEVVSIVEIRHIMVPQVSYWGTHTVSK